MMKAAILGIFYCMIIYMINGILGYLIYGDDIKASILDCLGKDINTYKNQDTFLLIVLCLANFGFILSSTMSIPLMFFSLKKNFLNTILYFNKKKENSKFISKF